MMGLRRTAPSLIACTGCAEGRLAALSRCGWDRGNLRPLFTSEGCLPRVGKAAARAGCCNCLLGTQAAGAGVFNGNLFSACRGRAGEVENRPLLYPHHFSTKDPVKGRHRALSEATFFADPKLDARPLWRGLRNTFLLHETSLAAQGSQDGPAQPCQHEGGSTKDLMVITRWMSYEAAL